MEVKEAHDWKFGRCNKYFQICRARDVGFKHHHLTRLISEIDLNIDLGLKRGGGISVGAISTLSSYIYGMGIKFSEDRAELIRYNPFEEFVYHPNPLLSLIPKDNF